MIVNCPRICEACHLLDPKVRCDRKNLNVTEEHVYAPGDMSKMFNAIAPTFHDRYGVKVLMEDPFIVTFDNFLTDQEIDALLESVDGNWERSTGECWMVVEGLYLYTTAMVFRTWWLF